MLEWVHRGVTERTENLYTQYRKTRYRPLRPIVILSGFASNLSR